MESLSSLLATTSFRNNTDRSVENWFRQFLLILAAAVFLMTPVDLFFGEHTESTTQWIPFIASGFSLVGIAYHFFLGSRISRIGLKSVLIVSALSGIYGVYEHFMHNLGFELDIRPNSVWSDVYVDALFGASPIVSPGILVLGAVLGLAAIHRVADPD